jgi:signal transduction histidine kinase
MYLPGRESLPGNCLLLAEGQRAGRICVLRDESLQELDTLKSEFVSTVSHDLRSPLMMMRGYTTMLEMVGELNEQQTGYMRKIMKGVEDMTRLVNNLLDLGRIEAGLDLNLEMIAVSDLIGRVTGSMQLQAAQKHLQLMTELPPDTVPLVEADPNLLQQALSNLLDNAIKYTESGEKVTVRVYARENNIVFEIKDTGIGIAPVDQSRLFEVLPRCAAGGHEVSRHRFRLGDCQIDRRETSWACMGRKPARKGKHLLSGNSSAAAPQREKTMTFACQNCDKIKP